MRPMHALTWALTSSSGKRVILDMHQFPIKFPEAAHGRFRGAGCHRAGALATHLDHRVVVEVATNALFDEGANGAVFHRNIAGRPDQIALLAADHRLLWRVLFEAEHGPDQLAAIDAQGHDLSYPKRVHDLV